MTITPAYIPGPQQTDQQAQARAQALGIGLASRTVPPCYQAAVTSPPGVVAEYGAAPTVVFVHDDGTLTAGQVSLAIQPLVTQQAADQQAATTQQAIQAALSVDFTAMAQIITQANVGTLTAIQLTAAVKAIAQAIRHQLRIDLALFDAST